MVNILLGKHLSPWERTVYICFISILRRMMVMLGVRSIRSEGKGHVTQVLPEPTNHPILSG